MARICDFCGKVIDNNNANDKGWSMALYPQFVESKGYKYDICQQCLDKLKKENKE